MKKFYSPLIALFITAASISGYSQCLTISVSGSDVSCFASNDGQVIVDVNSGVGPFTYELFFFQPGFGTTKMGEVNTASTSVVFEKDNGTLTIPGANAFGIQANNFVAPGSEYQVRVSASGAGGFLCEIKSASATIDQPPLLVASLVSITAACTPGVGAIDIDVVGGTPGYSYSWTGPTPIGDVQDPTGLNAGTYSVVVTDFNSCQNTTLSAIVVPVPTTAAAGGDQDVCVDNAVLAANSVQAFETGTWTVISGTGSFVDANSPGTAVTGLSYGVNEFQWTITNNSAACPPSSDNVVINRFLEAIVDAGAPQIICEGTAATLAGTFGGSTISITWTTSGDGSFDDNTLPGAVYTPGPNDITSGTVTLTITSDNPPGPCGPVNDNMTLTINPAAIVDAGAPQTICADGTVTLAGSFGGAAISIAWSTSGDGGFNDATLTGAVYTPGANDITNGSVTLTITSNNPGAPCTPAIDNVLITINPLATVDAGLPLAVCSGSPAVLVGVFGGSATTITWSTAGDGSFDNNTLPGATYTPGPNDIIAGTVLLTLTTNDPAGPCAAVNDNVTITINPVATADAGPIQTICGNGTATMSGTFGGSATSITWSTAGDGSFIDNTIVNAVYTPGPNDITAGSVLLTLLTDDPAGPCPAASDNVVITITPVASVDAGPPQAVCIGSTATLAGTFGGSATSVTWSTAGDGSFNDNTLPGAVYTPGPNDITNGSVLLTLLTNDPTGPCAANSDNVVITINPLPTVDAGSPQTICIGATATLAGSFGGAASGITWSTAGDGSFNNNTLPGAVYTPGPNDIIARIATLTIATDDPAGPCNAVSANVIITLSDPPTATLSGDQAICAGTQAQLTVTSTGVGPWDVVYSDGVGMFNLLGIASPFTFNVTPATDVTYSLVSVSDACVAGSVSGTANVTVSPINGNPAVFGNETWIAYVYDDSGDASPLPGRIDFNPTKYRGFLDAPDIAAVSVPSYYVAAVDTFNLFPDLSPVFGPNLCNSYSDNFSIRMRMRKTFAAGVYVFNVGSDDGVKLFVDGVSVLTDPTAFNVHSFTMYSSDPICLTAGTHDLIIEYYEVTTNARLSFSYKAPSIPDTPANPFFVCVNSPAPTLTASSPYTNVVNFHWYSDAGLSTEVATGINYVPSIAELNTAVLGSTVFYITAEFPGGCESAERPLTVTVTDQGSLVLPDTAICEFAGVVDLTNFVQGVPPGGTFTFTGAGVSGNNFDPAGRTGLNAISVDYVLGTCSSSGTLNITVFNSSNITLPVTTPQVCASGGLFDLSTLVSGTPASGTFTFTGTGVAGNMLDPSSLSGVQNISVGYDAGGCTANATLQVDVTANATLNIINSNICQSSGIVNITGFISASPSGGAFVFSGTGVTGNTFDPTGLTGNININVDYDLSGCIASGVIVFNVLAPGDPLCTGIINCSGFTITASDTRPSCANQDDGQISLIITGGSGSYIVSLTDNNGFNRALTGSGPLFQFTNLSPADYDYTVTDFAAHSCTLPYSLPLPITVTASVVAGSFIDALCFNEPTGSAIINASGSSTGQYFFSVDEANWTSFIPGNPINTLPPNGTYQVFVGESMMDFCRDTVMVTINNLATSAIVVEVGTLEESFPERATGSMQLISFNGGEAPYMIRATLDSASVPGQSFNTTFSPVVTNSSGDLEQIYDGIPAGRYLIEVSDAIGCVKSFFVRVPLDIDLFIPNIFTPNGDNFNDKFYIRNLPPGSTVIITNRWGKEVFSSKNYQNEWDGAGETDGLYFFRFQGGGAMRTGWVEIQRGNRP